MPQLASGAPEPGAPSRSAPRTAAACGPTVSSQRCVRRAVAALLTGLAVLVGAASLPGSAVPGTPMALAAGPSAVPGDAAPGSWEAPSEADTETADAAHAHCADHGMPPRVHRDLPTDRLAAHPAYAPAVAGACATRDPLVVGGGSAPNAGEFRLPPHLEQPANRGPPSSAET